MSSADETRDSYRFAGRVDPNDTQELTTVMPDPCTVEDVRVRFYAGPRLDLRVYPFVQLDSAAGKERRALINFPDDPEAKDYLDGEDDDFGFDVSRAVEKDDVIGVEVENMNSSNAYDYVCDVIVDFEGGTSRPFGGVVESIRGWL